MAGLVALLSRDAFRPSILMWDDDLRRYVDILNERRPDPFREFEAERAARAQQFAARGTLLADRGLTEELGRWR